MAIPENTPSSSGRPPALLIALAVSLTLNVVTLIAFPALHFFHHRPAELGRGPGGDEPFRHEHSFGLWRGTPPTPAERAQHKLDFLKAKLALTDAETTQLQPILLQQATDLDKLHEQEKAAFQESMNQSDGQIRAVLTPDQQKELEAMKAEQAERNGHEPRPF